MPSCCSGMGPELTILREAPLEEIARAGGERLAEGIDHMRQQRGAVAQPGYDGEYGVIRVFGGVRVPETQMGLFRENADEGRHLHPPAVAAGAVKTKDEDSGAGVGMGVRGQEPGEELGGGGRGERRGAGRKPRGATPTLFVTRDADTLCLHRRSH